MKFRVEQYEFRENILHDVAAQKRLSFNHVIREPCTAFSLATALTAHRIVLGAPDPVWCNKTGNNTIK